MFTNSRETLERAAKLLEKSAQRMIAETFKSRYCPDCGARMTRDGTMYTCPACGVSCDDSDEPTAEFEPVSQEGGDR